MESSFEQFVDEHYQAAYRFALTLCCNPDQAGDLTQQAFFIAQTKGHQVRDPSKKKQWLFTVLRREFLHARRHVTTWQEQNLELSESSLPQITVDYAAKLDAQTLLVALQALDEHHRVPLSLFYFEQLSYKEIADIIEAPIGTVMSRLARAKGLLRERLEAGRTGGSEARKIVPLPGKSAKEDRHG